MTPPHDPPPLEPRAEAEEVANFENQLQAIRTDLAVLRWMAGTQIVLILFVLGKLFIV